MPKLSNIDFPSRVNFVDDLGADPSGTTPSDDAMEAAFGSHDTLIEVPAGVYQINEEHSRHESDTWGFVGLPDDHTEVQFRMESGRSYRFFNAHFARGEVGSFSVQMTMNFDRSGVVQAAPSDYLYGHDIEWLGATPDETEIDASGGWQFYPTTDSPDAVAEWERISKRGPVHYKEYNNAHGFAWAGRDSAQGKLILRDFDIRNSGESGLYLGKSHGPVELYDSYFENCQHTAIRVSGPNSLVEGCTVVFDWDNKHPDNNDFCQQGRLFWNQSDDVNNPGVTVRDCDFLYLSGAPTGMNEGMICNHSDTGGFVMQNCRLLNNIDNAPTINVSGVNSAEAHEPYEVVIEDCDFTGTADRGIEVTGRPESVIRDSCFDMPNASISGIQQENLALEGCSTPVDPGGDGDETGAQKGISREAALGLLAVGVGLALVRQRTRGRSS